MKTMNTGSIKLTKLDEKQRSELFSIIHFSGVIVTERTIKFGANEKNGQLSPMATKALNFCKNNTLQMISKPCGKHRMDVEFFQGKTQEVKNQWTIYIIK